MADPNLHVHFRVENQMENGPMTAPTLPATVDRSAMVQAVRDLLGVDLRHVNQVQLEREVITVECIGIDQDGRPLVDADGEVVITHQITIAVTP